MIFLQREMETMAIFKKSWNLNTVKFKRITVSLLHYTLVTLQKQLHGLFTKKYTCIYSINSFIQRIFAFQTSVFLNLKNA